MTHTLPLATHTVLAPHHTVPSCCLTLLHVSPLARLPAISSLGLTLSRFHCSRRPGKPQRTRSTSGPPIVALATSAQQRSRPRSLRPCDSNSSCGERWRLYGHTPHRWHNHACVRTRADGMETHSRSDSCDDRSSHHTSRTGRRSVAYRRIGCHTDKRLQTIRIHLRNRIVSGRRAFV